MVRLRRRADARAWTAAGAIVPAGMVAGVSAVALLFFVYSIATGGNPKATPEALLRAQLMRKQHSHWPTAPSAGGQAA